MITDQQKVNTLNTQNDALLSRIIDLKKRHQQELIEQKKQIREHIRESLSLLSRDIDLHPKIEEYKEAILQDLDKFIERV